MRVGYTRSARMVSNGFGVPVTIRAHEFFQVLRCRINAAAKNFVVRPHHSRVTGRQLRQHFERVLCGLYFGPDFLDSTVRTDQECHAVGAHVLAP